jgi:hypothetical protein
MSKLLVLIATLSFVASGARAEQADLDKFLAQFDDVKIGFSTYTEITAKFGHPNSKETSKDGIVKITYSTQKTTVSFPPKVGGFSVGNTSSITQAAIEWLTFDEHGVLSGSGHYEPVLHVECGGPPTCIP